MPGNTPPEALRAYVSPLQRAVSCLGQAKLTVINKNLQIDEESSWTLNSGDGMRLKIGKFEAEQRFQLIKIPEDDPRREAGRLRIRTLAYAYNLILPIGTLSWHWHPKGNSDQRLPHMHLPDDDRGHYPTPRFSLEDVIHWAITRGADPACVDWELRLMESDGIHKLHRSWSDRSPKQ